MVVRASRVHEGMELDGEQDKRGELLRRKIHLERGPPTIIDIRATMEVDNPAGWYPPDTSMTADGGLHLLPYMGATIEVDNPVSIKDVQKLYRGISIRPISSSNFLHVR